MEDIINKPSHYRDENIGHECIEFTRTMGFLDGNAFKYVWRAGKKKGQPLERDLRKAEYYLKGLPEMDFTRRPDPVLNESLDNPPVRNRRTAILHALYDGVYESAKYILRGVLSGDYDLDKTF